MSFPLVRTGPSVVTNNLRLVDGSTPVTQPLTANPDGFQSAPPVSVFPSIVPFLPPDLKQWFYDALANMGVLQPGQPAAPPHVVGPKTLRTLADFQATATQQSASTARHRRKPSYDAEKGTPMYSQHDRRWGHRTLGRHYQITNAGCAMTATAMAISKISGRKINPGQLDRYLDRHHGYNGDALNWDQAARARGLRADRWGRWSLKRIDHSLSNHKPVCIGVNYKKGSNGGPNGTDHWVTITARRKDRHGRIYYLAHDPGLGRRIKLYKHGNQLVSPRGFHPHYNSTGQLVTFHR